MAVLIPWNGDQPFKGRRPVGPVSHEVKRQDFGPGEDQLKENQQEQHSHIPWYTFYITYIPKNRWFTY